MSLVKPGVGETRASRSAPASRFSNDDLPTFERPMKANSGSDSSGHEARSGALQSKMADEMFTMENRCISVAVNSFHGYNHFPSESCPPLTFASLSVINRRSINETNDGFPFAHAGSLQPGSEKQDSHQPQKFYDKTTAGTWTDCTRGHDRTRGRVEERLFQRDEAGRMGGV